MSGRVGWPWGLRVLVTAAFIGAAVFLAVRVAEPSSSAFQRQLNDQVRQNTELHTRSLIHRGRLEAAERRISDTQAQILGRLGALETEVEAIKAEMEAGK